MANSLTRRRFIAAAAPVVLAPQALAAGLASAKTAPAFRDGRFSEGVMSGDPTPRGITLWTRLHDVERAGRVTLEVARERDFRRVVARKRIATDAKLDHAAKARVTGLRAHEQYYYRFATRTTHSPVGRFRTALPADSQQPVSFAFFSCQEFTHGFYNAHDVLAAGDYDFVICLGDYVYAEAYHSVQGGTGVRNDRIGEARTLAQYRAKYKLYREDAALRAVHRRFPIVTLWDDHEVQDNYAGAEPGGGLGPEKRYTKSRQRSGYRAFFDSMPYYPPSKDRVYRGLRFGRTVDLIVMDQRQYRADQPCSNRVSPPCPEWDQPRAFLGAAQMAWVKQRLARSPAAWKILANQLTMMPTKVLGGAFYEFDSWQGYPREREELLTHIRDRAIRDVVFVTGDIHTFISGDVRTRMGEGETVAVEFVGGSITSQGLGERDLDVGGGVTLKGNNANPQTSPAIVETLRNVNPWVDQADFDHHGFGKVTASATGLDCTLVRMETIKRRSTAQLPEAGYRYRVARGQQSIKGASH